MAYRDSTSAIGTSTSCVVAVPTGVQADDIVILVGTVDGSGNTFTGNWPAGFTQFYQTNLTGGDGQQMACAWKRLTGADSGNYTFGSLDAGAPGWVAQAVAFSGRHTTDAPVATAATDETGDNTTPVSIVASGVTAIAGDDLLWIAAPDVSATGVANGFTAPSSPTFVEREDEENGFSALSIATLDAASAGATGAITGTLALSSGNANWTAYLVRIPVAVTGAITVTQTSVISATASVLTHTASILYPGSVTPTITL